MIIVVLDKDREDLKCYEEGDVSLFEDTLTVLWDCDIVETYFINVSDKTWKKLADWDSVRLNLSEEEVREYLNKTKCGMGYVFIYENGKVKKCLPP
jgi:hypothetical protein